MEPHDPDPRDDEAMDPGQDDDAWDEARRRLSSLGERLRTHYRSIVGDDAPSEDDLRDAFRTLGLALERVIDSVQTAVRDPEVRAGAKDAAAGFVAAVGETLETLGDELRHPAGSHDDE